MIARNTEADVNVIGLIGERGREVQEFIREHLGEAGLAKQKWPEELRSVADFARTPSGKIKKFVLRQALRDEAGGGA